MDKKAWIEKVDERSFASTVAEEIATSLQEFIEENGRCSLVLAGGKTPASIYRRLALPPLLHQMDWEHTAFFLGDERFVPADDHQSNALMIKETLFHNLAEDKVKQSYFVDTSCDSVEASAASYEQTILNHFGLPQGQMPSFDLVLLGLGTDGHTASLFPDQDVWDTGKVCIATNNPNDNTERISLSPEALLNAKKVFFLVKGEGKASILENVLGKAEDRKKFPALLYRDIADRVTWFVDSAAGIKIS